MIPANSRRWWSERPSEAMRCSIIRRLFSPMHTPEGTRATCGLRSAMISGICGWYPCCKWQKSCAWIFMPPRALRYHLVRSVPTSARASRADRVHGWQAYLSTPVQKWNSLQGGQVHYADAAVGHQMTASSLHLFSLLCFILCLLQLETFCVALRLFT